MIKKIVLVFIIFLSFKNIIKSSNNDEIKLYSNKIIMYNLSSDEILFEINMNARTPIASLTKIMSVIVAIENIDDFNKKVIITKEMIDNIDDDVAIVGLKVGEQLTYNDLLYGAMLPSGADAINALGISLFGSIDNYVKKMNEKVDELLLLNTKFTDPVGLRDEDNYSSAFDLSKILMYSLKNEKFKNIYTSKKYKLSNGKEIQSTLERINEKYIKKDLSYIIGSKTGFTDMAGLCLSSTAKINGVDYMLITLNANPKISASHIYDTINLYTYYSSNYGFHEIISKNDIIAKIKPKYTKEKIVSIKANKQIIKYVSNNFDKKDISFDYEITKNITYFTKNGSIIGKANVYYKNKKIDEITLIFEGKLNFSLISFIKDNISTFLSTLLIISFLIAGAFFRKKRMDNRNLNLYLSDY